MKQKLSKVPVVARNLNERHNIEIQFSDERAKQRRPPNAHMAFYGSGVNDEHFRILLEAAGDLKGKTVLDFGCGAGHTSRVYADLGASRVEGFDISAERINIAQRNARRDHMEDRVFFRPLAAENIDYPDDFFDVVIGKAILHHTDLAKTSKQLARVLRPGGSAYFLEPLAHNLALNLFRRITPWRRTPTERPLRLHDLEVFRQDFEFVDYRGFYLFGLLANALLLVTGSSKLFRRSMLALLRWEGPVLTRNSWLQKYCWTALLVFRKGRRANAMQCD